jgi:hypothetical protein
VSGPGSLNVCRNAGRTPPHPRWPIGEHAG